MSVKSIAKREQVTSPELYPESSTMSRPPGGAPSMHEQEAPLYYDVPMVKRPNWGWEIAGYFFLGGLSAGAYLLGRSAERIGGRRYRKVARAGTAVAAAAFVPCTPLLIKDLGDPKRFHHMLRVIKPESPMNVGSWTLTGYGGALFLSALREWLRRSGKSDRGRILALSDVIGVPFSVMMASYTGVLLSTSSTPLWAKNPWLGPMFSASAIYNGTEAIGAALHLSGEASDSRASRSLDRIKLLARMTEAGTLGGYLAASGKRSKPITSGKYAPLLWGGAIGAGMLIPTVLDVASKRSERSGWLKVAAAAIGLAGSLALRWSIVYGGHESADDPKIAREATKPEV